MSQTPRGSDPYDYNPDYNRLNEQYNQPDQYGQPMMVPVGFLQKTPEQIAGEKAAQTSTVLGIIGLICALTFGWFLLGLPSLILGVIGIMKANEAERFGVAASAGRILNWITVVIGGMFLVLLGGSMLLAIMLALSDSAANSRLVDVAQMLALF